jgi:DNA-binding PadR family transcriptional regulator
LTCGALSVCALHVIAAGPTYGYAIASALADAGQDFTTVTTTFIGSPALVATSRKDPS